MLVATAGQRPLGIQIGQLLALLDTIGDKNGAPHLNAQGQVVSLVGLFATALKPNASASLTTNTLLDTLGRLIDWPLPYANAPSLFCFGLLDEFDVPDLIELCAPVPLHDDSRGPLSR